MIRIGYLAATLIGALLLAVLASQSPRPAPADAPPDAFSAERAMLDVREMARRPHPVGTAEHQRVREHLFQRLVELGLQPEVQLGVLSPEASRRLEQWSAGDIVGYSRVHNLVGVLPGRDRTLPAVLLMAHYDSAWGSPGAADDAAGVAAILETVRALRGGGPYARDLVVLITDAEELNLDGARAFFSEHPLRDRIGLIVNLEARGGGGRAMMFETGPGNAETIALFARAAGQVRGGVTSNSLATLVYENMPNGTDYTVPKARGVAGLNLAFIGRPSQYHSPTSTPEALDVGSVQHFGDQTLAIAREALAAPRLPRATRDVAFADLLGWGPVALPAGSGWLLLAACAVMLAGAGWLWRRELRPGDVARGALDALFAALAAFTLAYAVRGLAGPMGDRYGAGPDLYYTMLRRLPWIEAGLGLALLGLLIALLAGRTLVRPVWWAGGLALAAGVAVLAGGLNLIVLAVAGLAAALAFAPAASPGARHASAIGWAATALALGLLVQILAPTAAVLFLWPGLAFALGLAIAAALGTRWPERRALAPAAILAAPVVAWLLYQAHPVVLGVGMDLPGVAAVFVLLIGAGLRIFAPDPKLARPALIVAAALALAGAGVSAAARIAEPPPPSAQAGGPT